MLEKSFAKLYERDFNLWIDAQVEALRAARWQDLDLPNVIEELDSLGRRERRAMTSQFERLWLHLLKLECQPQKRTQSWEKSIDGALRKLFAILQDSPSLRPGVPAIARAAYSAARRTASRETRLSLETFPVAFPDHYEAISVDVARVDTIDGLDRLIRELLHLD
jgi:hypothetical protein